MKRECPCFNLDIFKVVCIRVICGKRLSVRDNSVHYLLLILNVLTITKVHVIDTGSRAHVNYHVVVKRFITYLWSQCLHFTSPNYRPYCQRGFNWCNISPYITAFIQLISPSLSYSKFLYIHAVFVASVCIHALLY